MRQGGPVEGEGQAVGIEEAAEKLGVARIQA
jgi:hypothetical protein